MSRRASAFALVVVACSLCLGKAVAASSAPRLEKTPPYVLAYCRTSRRLPLACPHLLPRIGHPSPHWETAVCIAGRKGCLGLFWDDLSLVAAGNGDRPPIWSHVSIYAGDLAPAFRFTYPTHGVRPRRLDGLFERRRTRAIFLGTYTWGGKQGTVVLAPGYPRGGEQGDHLVFRWRERGMGCAVGLHGWEPLSQALATLRSMVRSI
jgi:hypothetical protein